MDRHFPKEDLQMANKPLKRCSESLDTQEIEIKIRMKYHFTPTKMTIIKRKTITSIGKDVEKLEPLYTHVLPIRL